MAAMQVPGPSRTTHEIGKLILEWKGFDIANSLLSVTAASQYIASCRSNVPLINSLSKYHCSSRVLDM